ncbi:MAG: DUF3795 domain-containing protein [Spirochaetaceae bacterium]|jgi:hypothetical protein|nr:DUF3795 domain-containing protein [Spirochaetaceae bacterium]
MLTFGQEKIESYCGIECKKCEYQSGGCAGCIALKGILPWGKCDIAECAKEKGKRFCGECADFPCEIINRYSFDAEHGDNGARIEHCKALKAELVEEARQGINPIAYCGLSCNHCFLGQWCGGCKSEYNACGNATLFEDCVCPNVRCAKEQQIEGCYQCSELAACTKGFFENDNEAKASALFIQKYGEKCFMQAVTKLFDSGEGAKAFNGSCRKEAALQLLEKYKE